MIMTNTISIALPQQNPRSGLSIILRRTLRSTRGRLGAALLVVVVLIAAIGPFVAPHSSSAIIGQTFAGPNSAAWFGADALGRDVLSRVLDGGWVLIILAVLSTLIGIAGGAIAGLTAAYVGGKTEVLIMRVVDVALALPQIIFALLLLSVVGPKLWLLVLAVGLSHVPQVARVMFAAAQDVTERDFVKISRLWGIRMPRVLSRDVLPNLIGPVMVEFGLRLSFSIVMLAGLSFLGFGRQMPAADWGLMINENRLGIELNPLGVLVPAVLIAVLAVGANTLGDALARASMGEDSGEGAVLASTTGALNDR